MMSPGRVAEVQAEVEIHQRHDRSQQGHHPPCLPADQGHAGQDEERKAQEHLDRPRCIPQRHVGRKPVPEQQHK